MTDLTEQLRNGTLKEGFYYAKLPNNGFEIITDFGLNILREVKGGDKIEVLAPVPSYEEWQASYNCMLENEVLRLKNAKLKELLKECLAHLTIGKYGTSVTPINILCDEVEEALK